MNYIANRNKSILRRAQRNWRPLQIAMNEQSCVTVWILCFQNIPNSKRVFSLLRQCAVLAVPLHTTMLRETFAAVRRQTHTHTLWLRSMGFHSALCSLCTTAVQRESIKTSHVHYTTSSPHPHWLIDFPLMEVWCLNATIKCRLTQAWQTHDRVMLHTYCASE